MWQATSKSKWLIVPLASLYFFSFQLQASVTAGWQVLSWGGCPQLRVGEFALEQSSWMLSSLDIDLSCSQENPADSAPPSPEQLDAQLQQAISALAQLPLPKQLNLVVSDWQVTSPNLPPLSGSATLQRDHDSWSLQLVEDSGSQLELTLHAHTPPALRARLSSSLLNALGVAEFINQHYPAARLQPLQLNASLAEGLWQAELALGDLSAQLELEMTAPWLMHAQFSAVTLPNDLLLPASQWQLTPDLWQLGMADWNIEAQGRWQLAPLALSGRFAVKQLQLPLADLVPGASDFRWLSGQANGQFAYQPESLTLSTDVTALNALLGDNPIKDAALSGYLEYQPAQGWQHQGEWWVDEIDIGLSLRSLQGSWQQPWQPEPLAIEALQLSPLAFQLLGGEAVVNLLSLSPTYKGQLVFSGVSLPSLSGLYPDIGLLVEGELAGSLPWQWQGQGVSVEGGKLFVERPPGRIKINHAALASLKQQHPGLDFSLSLLEDFNYSQLGAEVDFSPEGDLDMRVNLYGRNQQVSPRPVELNYHHQENMYQLLRSLRIGDQLSGQVQQWIDTVTGSASSPSP
ncbi:intermembrane phospholipid transport protein YdbH family protein [Aliagarivorans marinus]|uniref:intermembrane phospholipid transport protein YdbH family protein n=1 Tax=Aliagarivorans marinus TaxID=561965 RepID=UPI000403FF4F|nr:YdbH domain-containing protein [Aliagarivorans marinus]